MDDKHYVVVTTGKDRRGVFFGELISQDGDIVVLNNAQMAIYWSSETHGVLGLAANGPKTGSKITPIVPRIEINGVTAIMNATDIAIEQWRKQLWE